MSLYDIGNIGLGWATITEAAQIAIELIKTTQELHEMGYIHQDIKLDNLMIKHRVPSQNIFYATQF